MRNQAALQQSMDQPDTTADNRYHSSNVLCYRTKHSEHYRI